MNREQTLQNMLEEVISASVDPYGKLYGTGLWKKCHKLADAHYLPAMEFFVHELDDSRWAWRRESVRLLGFHYKLGSDVLGKINDLLLTDPDSGVRIACASVLGKQLNALDRVLFSALDKDPEPLVKEAAFDAILDIAGIPYKKRKQEVQRIRSGEIKPSRQEIKRVMTEEGKFLDF